MYSPSERRLYPNIAILMRAFLKSSIPNEFTPKPSSSLSFSVKVAVRSLIIERKMKVMSSKETARGESFV
jgi:hypothetical protein